MNIPAVLRRTGPIAAATLFLSCLAPAGEEAGTPGPAAASADAVTVIYALDEAGPDWRGDKDAVGLLPLNLSLDWDEGEDDVDYELDLGLPDALETLIWDVLAADEFSRGEHDVQIRDDGSLVLTAPESVHRAFREVLDAVRAATHRQVELQVELYRLADVTALDDDADPVAAGGAVLLQRRTEQLTLSKTATLRAERTTPFVRDWEPEIAQSAAVAQPVTDDLSTGVVWMLRVEQDPSGGYRLRWLQRLSDVVEWNDRPVGAKVSITTDQSVITQAAMDVVEQPRVDVTTTTGIRHMDVGETVSVLAQMDTSGSGLLTRYTLTAVDAAPEPLDLGAGRQLVVMDVSRSYWPPVELPELRLGQLYPTTQDGDGVAPLIFPSAYDESGGILDAVYDALFDHGDEATSRWELGSWWALVGPQPALAAAEDTLRFYSPTGQAVRIEVGVGLAGARGPGRPVGHVVLPLQAQTTGLAVAGSCGLAIRYNDVDVANAASIGDPATAGYFDGLIVSAVVLADGTVDLDVIVHRMVERDEMASRSAAGGLDRLVFDRLRERRRVVADGRLHTWGGLGPNLGGDEALELSVRVVGTDDH